MTNQLDCHHQLLVFPRRHSEKPFFKFALYTVDQHLDKWRSVLKLERVVKLFFKQLAQMTLPRPRSCESYEYS
jgi:hypothetical protein